MAPNRFQQKRTVSWLTSIPRSCEAGLDVPRRRREPNAEHHRQPDDLGRGLEDLNGLRVVMPSGWVGTLPNGKPNCSDSASSEPILTYAAKMTDGCFIDPASVRGKSR